MLKSSQPSRCLVRGARPLLSSKTIPSARDSSPDRKSAKRAGLIGLAACQVLPLPFLVCLIPLSVGSVRCEAAPLSEPANGKVSASDPGDIEFFEKEVRPLLAKRCQRCHGPDKQK